MFKGVGWWWWWGVSKFSSTETETKGPLERRGEEWIGSGWIVGHWILTSCKPHRVTPGLGWDAGK